MGAAVQGVRLPLTESAGGRGLRCSADALKAAVHRRPTSSLPRYRALWNSRSLSARSEGECQRANGRLGRRAAQAWGCTAGATLEQRGGVERRYFLHEA
jgi:hypothetical protein